MVISSLGHSTGGGRGLVGGQRSRGCDRESHCGDIRRTRRGGASGGIFKWSESRNESCLGAGDRHTTNTEVLPEL